MSTGASHRSLWAAVGLWMCLMTCTTDGVASALLQQKDNNIMKHEANCWAEIYMNEEFDKNKPRLLLVGPHELPTLKSLNDQNWKNDIESIIMGPDAVMVAHEHENFTGKELILGPNQRIEQLKDAQMSNEIESLRLTCK